MIVLGLKGWELLTPSARRANSVRRDARATQCVKEAHSARIQDQPETGLIFNKLEEETSFGWSGSGRPFGSTEIVRRTNRADFLVMGDFMRGWVHLEPTSPKSGLRRVDASLEFLGAAGLCFIVGGKAAPFIRHPWIHENVLQFTDP